TNADGQALSRPDGIVVAAAVTHVAFLSNRTLLGAHVGAELLVPVVSFDLDVAPALQDGGTGIGDLVLGPLLLQWNGHSLFGRPLHHRLGINVTLPTGRHDGRRGGNVGHGTWQFNPHWAFTSMVSSRWEFSGRMHYLWVSESHDLPASLGAKTTQAGQAAHSNFALSYALTNGLRVGAAGYVLKQVTDHRIDGVDQAGSREQVIGLGPGLSWRVGGSTLFANVYLETAVRNRPKGARFFLRWSRPF
ncbi:MAG: transporter, partial [Gemmatimonadetes bacterium]|nr:transporter [Gemmatimonadota bacterium]